MRDLIKFQHQEIFGGFSAINMIQYQNMNSISGKFSQQNALWKHSPKSPHELYLNNVTRRNREIAEHNPSRQLSSSLLSAKIKSLRLYRHLCRMIPYLLKIHQIQHRTTPEQAKIYVANHFRANAQITQLPRIDYLVDQGYEYLHDAEFHFTQTGYLYKYLMSPKGILHDQGIDRYEDHRAQKMNRKTPASSFLKKFYNGKKSFEI